MLSLRRRGRLHRRHLEPERFGSREVGETDHAEDDTARAGRGGVLLRRAGRALI